MRKNHLLLLLLFFTAFTVNAKDVNILNYGAVPDGKTLSTKAIQQAIDECSQSGGGDVIIPAGTYLTGTIYLKNDVLLNLGKGATLLGSTDMKDYAPNALVRAEHQKNIGITGHGVIDGQGPTFWEMKKTPNKTTFGMNPAWNFAHKASVSGNLVLLEDCRFVNIENVTLRNSESWTLHLLACDDVKVHGITIRNPQHGPNTDGIDLNGSRRVMISDCDIYTNDDAICLKNKDPRYWKRCCEDITVTNCVITTSCNAFKIGTETIGDFRNIVFSNSVIKAGDPENELSVLAAKQVLPGNYGDILSPRSGIALETVDGANVSHVNINNIVMEARIPIFIRVGNRGRKGDKSDPNSVPGTMKDVIISNITAYNASTTSSITGLPGYDVENVRISNLIIRTKGGGDKMLAEKKLDEAEKEYPNGTMWGPIPASGIYVRHVKDLEIKDAEIVLDEADQRPLMIFDDVEGLCLNNLKTNDFHKGESIMSFTNVQHAGLFYNDFSNGNLPNWYSFSGNKTKDIVIFAPGTGAAEAHLKTDNTVAKGSIRTK
ncbi:MAG: glycosyl hydrolase family 28 protein [Bacteroidota bacterium]|nr:glycosyl hydrolase family 28 protein [Bacteroidota bacterium]